MWGGTLDKSDVGRRFDAVAERYDLMQRFNPGYGKHLRWSAQRLGAPRHGRVLDLCCGTGLSTEALVECYPMARLTGLDASRGMLDVARRKPALSRVELVRGDASDPQGAGVQGPFDAIMMAYGIRNLPDADRCLHNLRGLLRPGGRIAFHEYAVGDSRYHRALWNAVSSLVIVPLGRAMTGSSELFRYLRRSVNEFDSVDSFAARLRAARFRDIRTQAMDGWQHGIVHTVTARAPE